MEFRTTTSSDIPIIRKFLMEEVYPDEPISRAMNLLSDSHMLEFHLSLVRNGLSWVGFHEGELIGVALCGEKTLAEPERIKKEAERFKGSGWGRLLELFYTIETKARILQRFGVDRSYHCYFYAIKRSYRGEGLTSQHADSVQEYVDHIKNLGFKLATGDTTNFRSARLAEAFGGILCYEFPYSDFLDENGRPYIGDDSKHKFVRTYAYWIENWGKSRL